MEQDSPKVFKIKSKYKPSGDQPQAIEKLVEGIKENKKEQVLLGATGTGKTFTIANVIKEVNKPTLVLAHNKTLAGQLYSEFKELFPDNHVCYFVSYYDYYQPEAYVPSTDTYIEKDSSINDEIDELRHEATSSLLSHRDVIVVASVSCIYGIGEVEEYKNKMLTLSVGDTIERDKVLTKLVEMLYERNDFDFKRGTFRVRGDSLEIIPAYENSKGYRIEFFGDEIDRISEIDSLTGVILNNKKTISLFPASHFVVSDEKLKAAIKRIKLELKERLDELKSENKLLARERLEQRTNYDIEMLEETGFCSGIENYSAPMAGRAPGETPTTLMDFFPDDYLLVVDESHVTLPQVRGMYNGDRARKMNLVEYGFRLPSALDNRPLKYDEFEKKILSSEEFKRDWTLIKSLYPKETCVKGKLRRRLLNERAWTLDGGVSFNTQQSEFEAIFELFCWKYYLWAMDGDKPYIMKPSVNITPLGTQIFIPGYISYDAKRDFNHGKISHLHKAKGVQKQGLAFTESRTRLAALKKLALEAESEGRKNKLKGDKLLDFIASAIGRPDMDFRSIRKLIER